MEKKSQFGLKIKHANIILGVAFIVLSIAIAYICKTDNMKFYSNNAPGPGFMPMLSAGLIALCGIGITARSFIDLKNGSDPDGEKVIATWTEWKSFFIIIGSTIAVMLCTKFLGLIISVTIAVIMMIRLLGPEPWKTSLMVGIGTGIVIYLVFVVFLKVHVPVGIFGI